MTEFERRRAAFSKAIGDAVAVFPAAPGAVRSNDSAYPYRADSDLYYLTGFTEPDCVLVLAPSHPETKSIMFVQQRDRELEVWTGHRLGVEQAQKTLGVDIAYPMTELDERLPKLLDTSDTLYYALGGNERFNRRIVEHVRTARFARRRADKAATSILDPSAVLHEMRVRKSPAEIAGLHRTTEISAAGHLAAMRHSRPGMHEYEVEAIVEYVFTTRGAQAAYPSIVAGGNNATVLHYDTNRDRIADDALVLIDAGAELDCYCGDITRTWPMSGRFTSEQRAVYDIVLEAQRQALALCRPGVRYNTDVNDAAQRVMIEGLRELGLLKGSHAEILEKGSHKPFLPHRVGHFIGLDTHDVGFYRSGGDWRPLESGMVITIEPGLYIAEDLDVDARFKGIGVRIEDDVLITDGGHEILGDGLPKLAADIERTIAEGRESKEPLFA
ncbi:MAG TPA: aminopeptidase P N-terminal domain-containing protein [Candidatus Tumulicola sp.]|nr:aminopeptidase P N-terminal domain-containing protein [Candidatus Tumulicola sp.]